MLFYPSKCPHCVFTRWSSERGAYSGGHGSEPQAPIGAREQLGSIRIDAVLRVLRAAVGSAGSAGSADRALSGSGDVFLVQAETNELLVLVFLLLCIGFARKCFQSGGVGEERFGRGGAGIHVCAAFPFFSFFLSFFSF